MQTDTIPMRLKPCGLLVVLIGGLHDLDSGRVTFFE